MRAEDFRVRQELIESGELDGPYVSRMEAVLVRNAHRLQEIVDQHGWPDESRVGDDASKAAWLIIQHSVPEPGPELPLEQQKAIACNQRWWEDWLTSQQMAQRSGRSAARRKLSIVP